MIIYRIGVPINLTYVVHRHVDVLFNLLIWLNNRFHAFSCRYYRESDIHHHFSRRGRDPSLATIKNLLSEAISSGERSLPFSKDISESSWKQQSFRYLCCNQWIASFPVKNQILESCIYCRWVDPVERQGNTFLAIAWGLLRSGQKLWRVIHGKFQWLLFSEYQWVRKGD